MAHTVGAEDDVSGVAMGGLMSGIGVEGGVIGVFSATVPALGQQDSS
jgi:hypothetical protein